MSYEHTTSIESSNPLESRSASEGVDAIPNNAVILRNSSIDQEASQATDASDISDLEKDEQFEILYRIIQKTKKSILFVGETLLKIRDANLWYPAFTKWPLFVASIDHYDSVHVYRLMSAARFVRLVGEKNIGSITKILIPTSEFQIRAISPKLSLDIQIRIWEAAVRHKNGKQPSHHDVEEARKQIAPKTSKPPKANKKLEIKLLAEELQDLVYRDATKEKILDRIGELLELLTSSDSPEKKETKV